MTCLVQCLVRLLRLLSVIESDLHRALVRALDVRFVLLSLSCRQDVLGDEPAMVTYLDTVTKQRSTCATTGALGLMLAVSAPGMRSPETSLELGLHSTWLVQPSGSTTQHAVIAVRWAHLSLPQAA